MATKRVVKKSSTKKSTAKKFATKKVPKKSTNKSANRKYGPAASKQVETELHEMKKGKLKSGRSGNQVTNPKQAIAIGLSEARKMGAKVSKISSK